MTIITIGIDLAKNVFAVHGVNETGKPERVKLKVPRDQLMPLIANLPPCLIGMEACSGAQDFGFDQFRFACFIYAMNCKNVLGKIDTDGDNVHDFPLS